MIIRIVTCELDGFQSNGKSNSSILLRLSASLGVVLELLESLMSFSYSLRKYVFNHSNFVLVLWKLHLKCEIKH